MQLDTSSSNTKQQSTQNMETYRTDALYPLSYTANPKNMTN